MNTTTARPATWIEPEDAPTGGFLWTPRCDCGWASPEPSLNPDDATDAAANHTCPEA